MEPLHPFLADDDLEQRVRVYLSRYASSHARRIRIEVHQGVVTLCGALDSVQAWEACIEACRCVAGVTRVVDELSVPCATHSQPPGERPTRPTSAVGAFLD